MWFRQKQLELLASTELNGATMDYCWRMHECCYRAIPDGRSVWVHLARRREPFLAAARTELGVPAPSDK
jgi:hypothetical protein